MRLFAAAVFILSKLFHFGFLEGTAAEKPLGPLAVDEWDFVFLSEVRLRVGEFEIWLLIFWVAFILSAAEPSCDLG